MRNNKGQFVAQSIIIGLFSLMIIFIIFSAIDSEFNTEVSNICTEFGAASTECLLGGLVPITALVVIIFMALGITNLGS